MHPFIQAYTATQCIKRTHSHITNINKMNKEKHILCMPFNKKNGTKTMKAMSRERNRINFPSTIQMYVSLWPALCFSLSLLDALWIPLVFAWIWNYCWGNSFSTADRIKNKVHGWDFSLYISFYSQSRASAAIKIKKNRCAVTVAAWVSNFTS